MDVNSSVTHDDTRLEDSSKEREVPTHIEGFDDYPEGEPDNEISPLVNTTSPELWSTTRKKRGRHPKDPDAEYIRFDCKDLDDLEGKLKDYLEAPTAVPEHAIIEFHFSISSAFMVYSRDYKRDPNTPWTAFDVPDILHRTTVSVHDVMQSTDNPKEQIIRQKAVARVCVEAIQRVDGFRYSFHNNWLSREDKAHRFSFFCNDSTLNKGRAAGGGVKGSGKEPRKPIYECQGLIAVKFSITKNNLEVHYRHVPVHKTYEERAPPPRKESKRFRLLELLNPEHLHNSECDPHKKTKTVHPVGRISKRGRPRKSNINQLIFTSEQEGERTLQPLVNFLGAPARTSSNGEVVGSDNLDGAGGESSRIDLIGNADDHSRGIDTTYNDNGSRAQHRPVFPVEKMRKLQNTFLSSPKLRKGAIPNLPGMMTGSIRAGDITWANAEMATDKGDGKKKDKGDREANTICNESLAEKSLSEIKALKQKLMEAEQRIQRLESEKRPPPLPPAYLSRPPYPYQHSYHHPAQDYDYHAGPPPPTPSPPSKNNPYPNLRVQHYAGPGGQDFAVEASSQPSVPVSVAAHPSNFLAPATSPPARYLPKPASTPTHRYRVQPKTIDTAGVIDLSGSEPPKRYPTSSTESPISCQQPSDGTLKLGPNSPQAQTPEDGKTRNVTLGDSQLGVDPTKEASVHYSRVPTITAASWAPVAVSSQGTQSAQSQRMKQKILGTSDNDFGPVQQLPGSSTLLTPTPVTTTPITTRINAETSLGEADAPNATASTPATLSIAENEVDIPPRIMTSTQHVVMESHLAGIQAATANILEEGND